MDIVFLDTASLGLVPNLDIFSEFGNFRAFSETSPEERLLHIGKADIVISNKVKIDREIINKCPDIKLICIAATGMNNVDLNYAAEKNIPVKNVAGYATDSVAQVTFSLILALVHQLDWFNRYIKQGDYSKAKSFTCYEKKFFELKGKQLGIIGLGAIGRRVAEIADVFGMKVVYSSTSGKTRPEKYECLALEELLASSDIISIHSPLNKDTYNLINAGNLKLMKKSAVIINTGRGKIINETDLADALNEGIISGAALDVHANEPLEGDSPLLKLKDPDKLIQTPHIGWAAVEARTRLVDAIAENIRAFLTL